MASTCLFCSFCPSLSPTVQLVPGAMKGAGAMGWDEDLRPLRPLRPQ